MLLTGPWERLEEATVKWSVYLREAVFLYKTDITVLWDNPFFSLDFFCFPVSLPSEQTSTKAFNKYVGVLVIQLCPTLCDPKDYSLPSSSVHGILQARTLKWVAIPFSRGCSLPRDWTQVSHFAVRFFTISATRKAQICWYRPPNYYCWLILCSLPYWGVEISSHSSTGLTVDRPSHVISWDVAVASVLSVLIPWKPLGPHQCFSSCL